MRISVYEKGEKEVLERIQNLLKDLDDLEECFKNTKQLSHEQRDNFSNLAQYARELEEFFPDAEYDEDTKYFDEWIDSILELIQTIRRNIDDE